MQTERRRPEADKATENAAATSEAAGWIDHTGAGMPVDAETVVEVRHADGDTSVAPAGLWDGGFEPWDHQKCSRSDMVIVAYRIVGAAA